MAISRTRPGEGFRGKDRKTKRGGGENRCNIWPVEIFQFDFPSEDVTAVNVLIGDSRNLTYPRLLLSLCLGAAPSPPISAHFATKAANPRFLQKNGQIIGIIDGIVS